MPIRHGGEIVVDALKRHGCEAVFTVPGESFLGILDHLIDTPEIKLITCRHEAGAAYMAEAYGKLTGKPAVCLVTRGPGACNASIGLHAAKHDSTPMVLLIGHVSGYETQRESFQEIEYRHMFSELSKWVAEIPTADRHGLKSALCRGTTTCPSAMAARSWSTRSSATAARRCSRSRARASSGSSTI